MIDIKTALRVDEENSTKTVVMEMDVGDAFALATILMNLDGEYVNVSPEWDRQMRVVARLLVDAGNRCL